MERETLKETVSAAQQSYDQIFDELNATQEKLYQANETIKDYERTMTQNTEKTENIKEINNKYVESMENTHKKEILVYKEKCENLGNEKLELYKQLEMYRNYDTKYFDLERKYTLLKTEFESVNEREKYLSDQILQLTYDKVGLEKELNKTSEKLYEKENEICNLQNKNEELMNTIKSSNGNNPNSLINNMRYNRLYSFAANNLNAPAAAAAAAVAPAPGPGPNSMFFCFVFVCLSFVFVTLNCVDALCFAYKGLFWN